MEHYDGERGYCPPELVEYLANPADVHLEPLQRKPHPKHGQSAFSGGILLASAVWLAGTCEV